MCDRIALMKEGRIVQLDTPMGMYENPANAFVAGFLGNPPISFVSATAAQGALDLGQGVSMAQPAGLGDRGPVTLGIRPEHFGPQYGDQIGGEVVFVEPQGREELVDVRLATGKTLRAILPGGSNHALGQRVAWGIHTDRVLTFDQTGNRI